MTYTHNQRQQHTTYNIYMIGVVVWVVWRVRGGRWRCACTMLGTAMHHFRAGGGAAHAQCSVHTSCITFARAVALRMHNARYSNVNIYIYIYILYTPIRIPQQLQKQKQQRTFTEPCAKASFIFKTLLNCFKHFIIACYLCAMLECAPRAC